MPELAEVERVRALLERHILNKKITKVIATEDPIVFDDISSSVIQSSIMNSTVVNVGRKGKIFWFEFDSVPHMSFHLGMTGRVIVKGEDTTFYYRFPDKNEIVWPPKFCKLIIEFNDGTMIAYTNSRRFGRVRLHKLLPYLENPIAKLGYDPYTDMCDLPLFQELMRKRRCPLKTVLLDQSFMAGIGNWIADEVCYQSGIHPRLYCHEMSDVQINIVWNRIQSIVNFAVAVDADYHRFPSNWIFHYRWDKARSTAKKKKNKNKKKKKKKKNKKMKMEMDSETKTETFVNCDSLGNEIIFENIGGRTSAIVYELQSKTNGYRALFSNWTKVGKMSAQEIENCKGIQMEVEMNENEIGIKNDCNSNHNKVQDQGRTQTKNKKKSKASKKIKFRSKCRRLKSKIKQEENGNGVICASVKSPLRRSMRLKLFRKRMKLKNFLILE